MIKPIALTSALFIGLITQASAAGLNTERNISSGYRCGKPYPCRLPG